MPLDDDVFANGEKVPVGNPVENAAVFANGELITDGTASQSIFVDGRGLGGVSVVEDFESCDLTAYKGDTSNFQISTSTVFEGSCALATPANQGDFIYRDDVSIAPDVTLRWRQYPSVSNSDPNFAFAVQDGNNYYRTNVNDTSDQRLIRVTNGSGTTIASGTTSIAANQWNVFELTWTGNGKIEFSVGGNTITATDTTFSGGGIGFPNTDPNHTNYIDLVEKV